jgi:hypothetical protein
LGARRFAHPVDGMVHPSARRKGLGVAQAIEASEHLKVELPAFGRRVDLCDYFARATPRLAFCGLGTDELVPSAFPGTALAKHNRQGRKADVANLPSG